MIDKRIGQRFKQCREKLGLTQEEFAKKLSLIHIFWPTSAAEAPSLNRQAFRPFFQMDSLL